MPRKYKSEVVRLTEGMAEEEERVGRLEVGRKGLEADNNKLMDSINDKEASLKVSILKRGKKDQVKEGGKCIQHWLG